MAAESRMDVDTREKHLMLLTTLQLVDGGWTAVDGRFVPKV